MSITIRQADYSDPADARAMVDMLDQYAQDPMGGGKPLHAHTREHLAAELATRPYAVTFLAFDDGAPAGVLNAFEGFSTFACKPLLNVHDIAVHAAHRGKGIGRRLLDAAEAEARKRGCCKLTLEVLSGNMRARSVYEAAGYHAYELDPEKGHALFLEKAL
ncbi:GNAT family N-acetyltransferase [uncultured Hyphomonas sp.]|uniref:GNAT family N-acetyltransferase n=1 Tax=uncultured Hyphomonas sp. TaxID=225298 RepID=UPI002AAB1ACC|nr:GNAT family N-acetyltransferase [uncultured Hyphomonas sp.]